MTPLYLGLHHVLWRPCVENDHRRYRVVHRSLQYSTGKCPRTQYTLSTYSVPGQLVNIIYTTLTLAHYIISTRACTLYNT